jgi:hypothetical protein
MGGMSVSVRSAGMFLRSSIVRLAQRRSSFSMAVSVWRRNQSTTGALPTVCSLATFIPGPCCPRSGYSVRQRSILSVPKGTPRLAVLVFPYLRKRRGGRIPFWRSPEVGDGRNGSLSVVEAAHSMLPRHANPVLATDLTPFCSIEEMRHYRPRIEGRRVFCQCRLRRTRNSYLNFTFAQNHTPAAPSVQPSITMAFLRGIAARFGCSAGLLCLFCQP